MAQLAQQCADFVEKHLALLWPSDTGSPAMPLTEHRSRIAIADEGDSAEHELTHGLVDLAAALADDSWGATPLGTTVEALYDAFQAVVPYEVSDQFGKLEFTREETVRYGARLGFALARTVSAADRGWKAWMVEAEAWLQAANCGVEAHQGTCGATVTSTWTISTRSRHLAVGSWASP
jgi:hypothetical protein